MRLLIFFILLSFYSEAQIISASSPYRQRGSAWIDLPFGTLTNITESPATVFTATSGSWGASGLSSKYLPPSTDGGIIFKIVAGGAGDCIIGFNATNANQNYNWMEAGYYANYNNGTLVNNWKIDSGTPSSLGTTSTVGDYVGVFRVGSEITIRKSTVKYNNIASWTTVATLTYSSTAALYININIDIINSQKLYYPQGLNVQ